VNKTTKTKDLYLLQNIDLSDLYRSIFENSLACIYVTDLQGNFLDGNQVSLDLLGYKRKDIPKLNFVNIVADKDLERAFKVLQKAIREGRQEKVEEFALKRKDGTLVPVKTVTNFIYKNGEPIALHGISVDISDLKKAQEAIVKSEQRYRAIIEKGPDAIIIRSKNGIILDANIQATKLSGYSKKELIGRHVHKLYSPQELKRVKKAMERANRYGRACAEVNLLRKNGRKIDVEVSASCFTVGQEVLYKIVYHDITEQKNIQERLKNAKLELEAQVAERTMELMQSNTALRVLMREMDRKKTERERKLMMSLQAQISPHIQALNKGNLSASQQAHAKLIEEIIQNITAKFTTKTLPETTQLTPREIQVASLVREGMVSKDIAKLMRISRKTVDIFRSNIRKKMGLKDYKVSLRSRLLAL
jgi:PAS domain S-box-containing protein